MVNQEKTGEKPSVARVTEIAHDLDKTISMLNLELEKVRPDYKALKKLVGKMRVAIIPIQAALGWVDGDSNGR